MGLINLKEDFGTDTDAIKAAFAEADARLCTIYVPKGIYLLSEMITFGTRVSIVCEGGALFQAHEWQSGNWMFKQRDMGAGTISGFQHMGLRLELAGQPVGGFCLKRPYDACGLVNVTIQGVACNQIGLAINTPSVGDEYPESLVGQTFSMNNVLVIRDNNRDLCSPDIPAIIIERMQECVFTSVKGWGMGPYGITYGRPVARSMHLKNCRSITFQQPSFADCAGVMVEGCENIKFDNPLYEDVENFLQIVDSSRIVHTKPRYEGTNTGRYWFTGNGIESDIETGTKPVRIETGPSRNVIRCIQGTDVVDLGPYNLIIKTPASANEALGFSQKISAQQVLEITAPGRSDKVTIEWLANAITDNLVEFKKGGHTFLLLLQDGTGFEFRSLDGQFIGGFKKYASPNLSTAVLAFTLDGQVWRNNVIEVGPENSGGSGYRALRVPN